MKRMLLITMTGTISREIETIRKNKMEIQKENNEAMYKT